MIMSDSFCTARSRVVHQSGNPRARRTSEIDIREFRRFVGIALFPSTRWRPISNWPPCCVLVHGQGARCHTSSACARTKGYVWGRGVIARGATSRYGATERFGDIYSK